MRLGYVVSYREPYPKAARSPRLVGAVKAIKELAEFVLIEVLAVIHRADSNALLSLFETYFYRR